MVNAITGSQFRAARGLLNLSVAELAEQTGFAVNTIRKAENTNGPAPITVTTMNALRRSLEEAGVMFIPADDYGPGVRLRAVEPLPDQSRRRAGTQK